MGKETKKIKEEQDVIKVTPFDDQGCKPYMLEVKVPKNLTQKKMVEAVRKALDEKHAHVDLLVHTIPPFISRAQGTVRVYAASVTGNAEPMASVELPSDGTDTTKYMRSLLSAERKSKTLLVQTEPPILLEKVDRDPPLWLVVEYTGHAGKEELSDILIARSEQGARQLIQLRALERVRGDLVLEHNADQTRYTMECLGISYVWSLCKKGFVKNSDGWQQPCWECAHSVPSRDGTRGCPWSLRFEPIPGWDALKTQCEDEDGEKDTTYKISRCPNFKRG